MKTTRIFAAAILLCSISNLAGQDTQYPSAQGEPCVEGADPWHMGGDNILPPFGWSPFGTSADPLAPRPRWDIGTCNNFPFVLKANDFESVFIQPSGFIGINVINPFTTLDIRHPSDPNASRFRIYGDAQGNVESTSDMRLHYVTGSVNRFEINQGAPGNPVPRFAIDGSGIAMIHNKLDVGAGVILGTGARVAVDGTTTDGLLVVADNANLNNNKALMVANAAGAPRLRVWVNSGGGEDTKTHIAGSTQLGFIQNNNMVLEDNNTRLNVEAKSGLSGIKVTAQNGASGRMIFIKDVASSSEPFEIHSNGRTFVGDPTTFYNSGAMLNVDSRSMNGINIMGSNNKNPLHISNGNGAPRFVFAVNSGGGDDSRCHIMASTQIGHVGNVPSALVDPNTRLNVEAFGTTLQGIRVSMNSAVPRAFFVHNPNHTQNIPFSIMGDGRTQINGELGGVAASQYWLTVNGTIGAREVKVTTATPWPDYVFEKSYSLLPLSDVKNYVAKHKHLPNIPSATELSAETCGLNLGEMQVKQMEKIEELFLHMISMEESMNALRVENENLRSEINTLKGR